MKTLQTPVGTLLCWDADDITKALERGEFWDAHLKEAIDATPVDGWALDLGANIGFFTAYFAQRFEHVLAVEAHPATAKLLYRNCQNEKVEIVSAAAYDREIPLALASTAVHGWQEPERSFLDVDTVPHAAGFTFVEDPSQQHHLHEWPVSAVRVEDLVPEEAVVRLIKCDVQGADLRALKGCERVITRCKPRIIFEFERHVSECRGDFWPDYLDFFNTRGYDVERLHGPSTDYLAVPR